MRPKSGNIVKLSLESRRAFLSQPRGSGSAGKKKFEKSLKMFLTKRVRFDIIIKLSQNSSAENFPSIYKNLMKKKKALDNINRLC